MSYKLENLDNIKHIHLVGIGGVSMSAIAETLHKWGYTVTGSDACKSEYTNKLIESGIKVTIGHDLTNSKNTFSCSYKSPLGNILFPNFRYERSLTRCNLISFGTLSNTT